MTRTEAYNSSLVMRKFYMYLSLPPSLSFLHTYKLSFTRNTRHNIKAINVYNFCNQIQKYEDIPTMRIVIIIVKNFNLHDKKRKTQF